MDINKSVEILRKHPFFNFDWFKENFVSSTEPYSERDVIDFLKNLEQNNIIYQTKENEWSVKEIIKGEDLIEAQQFLDKFFSNLQIKKKLNWHIKMGKRKLARDFLIEQPLYYDKNKIWTLWDWNKYCWIKTDDIEILNLVADMVDYDTIDATEKNEIIEALKQESRKLKPLTPESSWVQFKKKLKNIETCEEMMASPKYFIFNPIPYDLGTSEETPEIDKLFVSWVGEEHRQELYEVLAFLLITSYFIHRIIILLGSGANGKGTFQKIVRKFLGSSNITSSSLSLLLQSRFEGSKLYKKLVCQIGETNFTTISKTEYLKNLTGEDLVRIEFKGKDGFDEENYAKIIINTNSLPPTLDKTDGFYRRQKIIDFPNQFPQEKDVLVNIPEQEYNNLALKCFNIASRLWKERIFTNDGNFEERKKRYEEKSNPLMLYLKKSFEKDINKQVLFQDFYESLGEFLEENGYRSLTAMAVSKQLKAEGYEVKQLTRNGNTGKYIIGITEITEITHLSTHPLYRKSSKNMGYLSNLSYFDKDSDIKNEELESDTDKNKDEETLE